MIPKIDLQIGINVYSTKFSGIGGKIRLESDGFEVKEVISEKSVKSIKEQDGYAVYLLKKKKIDTNHALLDLFKKKGIRLKSLGLKDANAKTEQYVCSNNKNTSLERYTSEKYSIEKIGHTKKPLTKKDMIGNFFKIKIYDGVGELSGFADYDKILNFYGYQRFGSKRPVTHLIGKALLQSDLKRAIDLIVSFTSPFDSKENTEIREKLADKGNFEKYFSQIPPQMDIERIVIKEMIEHNDEQKAIRAIPLPLRRFYIQAFQSFIFNRTLSSAFLDGENLSRPQEGDVCFDSNGIIGKYHKGLDQQLALPFVGYSYYKKTRFDFQISKILADEEILPRSFYIKEMQEISNEGGFRQAVIQCSNYLAKNDTVQFTLSRGSFATMILREIMKPKDPIIAGF